MNKDELINKLVELGMGDNQTLEQQIMDMPAGDFIELVNTVNTENQGYVETAVEEILNRNPITTQESEMSMLEDIFAAMKSGKSFDNADVLGAVRPIAESDALDAANLKKQGFDYFMQLEDNASREKVMDWLEENEIEFVTDGTGCYHIKCGDRETAYKVGKVVGGLASNKTIVHDSIEDLDEAKSKSAKKREAEAKEKIANLKARNPELQALAQRTGKGAHEDPAQKARKKDAFDRKAKHKTRPMEEQMTQETQSPAVIEEGVVSPVQPVGPLFRLRELAGLDPIETPMVDDEIEVAGDIDADLDGIEIADDTGFVEPMAMVEPASDLPVDAAMDIDAEPMGMDDAFAADDLGGVPGDLPPMPVEAPMAVPTQSDAMSAIEDSMNQIQNKLADIRVSEYKALVLKLTNLAQQVQTMGRDYLGERRKK